MAPQGKPSDAGPYRPTSLDFINRPNPVEPQAPLHGTPRLEDRPSQNLIHLLHTQNIGHSIAERPAKRRKSGDTKAMTNSLDLPIPAFARKAGAERLRIPPTLSGLHQPPPNAGLLPSMSVEQPVRFVEKAHLPVEKVVEGESEMEAKSVDPTSKRESQLQSEETAKGTEKGKPPRRKHKKWSNDETADLLKGAAKFGVGNWTQILKCKEYNFNERTALDLKDRFRICCPDDYKIKKKQVSMAGSNDSAVLKEDEPLEASTKTSSNPTKAERMSRSARHQLGIEKPFSRSGRRKRTGYSDAEDQALWRGFQKHGTEWSLIKQDEKIFHNRTTTDLRDRFRTKYPAEYADLGLALRQKEIPKKAGPDCQEDEKGASSKEDSRAVIATPTEPAHPKKSLKSAEKENKEPEPTPPKTMHPTDTLPTNFDPFWGAPFEDSEPERIVLDRSILDVPYDTHKPFFVAEAAARGNDIDPRATAILPLPTLSAVPYSVGRGPLPDMTAQHAGNTVALPSLAAITDYAGTSDFWGQIELPSLVGDFEGLETDVRTIGQIMSWDELLS